MAKSSKFERYRTEIEYLLGIWISIKSAWKIINHALPEEAKMSYSAFFHYVKKTFIVTIKDKKSEDNSDNYDKSNKQ